LPENQVDAEQMKEIFKVIKEDVPELLDRITKILYNSAEAEKFGVSVATFYKALKDAGMTNEQAFELTRKFMDNTSLGGMLKNMVGGAAQGAASARKE